jgi:hypothetical protein
MRAALESVEPDLARAREFLAQARTFLADADRQSTSLESSVVLYWNACISAMDAILAAAGLRIGSGEQSHIVRVRGAAGAAGVAYAELFERLDEWRRERHDVSYAAVTPPAADVAAMQTDARDVIEAADFVIATGDAQGR